MPVRQMQREQEKLTLEDICKYQKNKVTETNML